VTDEKLRVLTVRQPHATLIINRIKDVENRSRRTHYRGSLLIHSAKVFGRANEEAALDTIQTHGINMIDAMLLCSPHWAPRGFILGTVEVVGCVQDSSSEWAEPGKWHWILENPQPWPEPVLWRGQQGLWQITQAELDEKRREMAHDSA